MFLRTLAVASSLACIAVGAKAHEFWIYPKDHQVQPGDLIQAALLVGQGFEGNSQPFLPPKFRRFDVAMGNSLVAAPGRAGDRPALKMRTSDEGLLVVIHETTDTVLTWDEYERFVGFVEHKDAEWTLAEHDKRGLSREGIREVYSRYAKSLIAVGHGRGEDRAFGLETEIVALENPYTDNMGDGFTVRVLYRGKPRSGEQVEIYDRAPDETVTVTTTQTNADGVAVVPVKPGHRYMLDSVVLREPSAAMAAERNVVWESLWANLTFAVPAQ